MRHCHSPYQSSKTFLLFKPCRRTSKRGALNHLWREEKQPQIQRKGWSRNCNEIRHWLKSLEGKRSSMNVSMMRWSDLTGEPVYWSLGSGRFSCLPPSLSEAITLCFKWEKQSSRRDSSTNELPLLPLFVDLNVCVMPWIIDEEQLVRHARD